MQLDFLQPLVKDFSKIREVESIYAYGSVLSDNFDKKIKDIDLLLIVKEKNQMAVIRKIRQIKRRYDVELKLDLNICFDSEFNERVHVNRPPTYFLGIARRNALLYGKDLLKKVKNEIIPAREIFKRVINLAQSCRALYINKEEKDADFWIKYQRKWLVVAFLEALYLDGIFELDKKKGLGLCIKESKAPKKFINLLKPEKTNVKLLYESSEWLREYVLKKHY